MDFQFYAERPQHIVGDVLMLPQKGSTSGGSKRPLNSWAILRGEPSRGEGYSVLFDAPYSWTLDGIARLADEGRPPRALVLSHRNTAGSGDAFETILSRFDVPVMLHPSDAAHDEARESGIDFVDPTGSTLLEKAGLECIHVPGHTAGSIMLYLAEQGGILLAGDAAVGPGPEQNPDEPVLQRPKMSAEAERTFVPAWHRAAASLPIAAVLPLHGRPWLASEVGEARFATLLAEVSSGAAMDPSRT